MDSSFVKALCKTVAATALLFVMGTAAAQGTKPNIVYIVADDLAAANPDKVATLQKRANELAATMAKPMLLQAEFNAMRERLHMPPALPKEESSFNEED